MFRGTALLIPIIFVVALPVFLTAEYRAKKRIFVLPFKLLCSLCFMTTAFVGLQNGVQLYDILMLIGLSFSLVGDMALIWKDERKPFLIGLSAFLIAQVIYSVTFIIYNGLSIWDLPLFAVFFLVPIIAYRYLDMEVGRMKVPVLLYVLVISVMFATALSSLFMGKIHPPAQWLIPLGAGLFYVSDAVLALFKFHRRPLMALRAVNLSTYFIGQMLLAASIYYF